MSKKAILTAPLNSYDLKPHFPMDSYRMARIWRRLRSLQKGNALHELSEVGTSNHQGQTKLLVLVDQQGSMEPFSLLISTFLKSLSNARLFSQTYLYYFHDCPEGFLCKQSTLTGTISIDRVLSTQGRDTSILIVSDAGAAFGFYERRRLKETSSFLQMLRDYTPHLVWLNPMPSHRWKATTAEGIARFVDMFPIDKEGLNNAFEYLLGISIISLRENLDE